MNTVYKGAGISPDDCGYVLVCGFVQTLSSTNTRSARPMGLALKLVIPLRHRLCTTSSARGDQLEIRCLWDLSNRISVSLTSLLVECLLIIAGHLEAASGWSTNRV